MLGICYFAKGWMAAKHELMSSLFARDRGKGHFAVAARTEAAEAVPFREFQALQQGVEQGFVIAVELFDGELEVESGTRRARARFGAGLRLFRRCG